MFPERSDGESGNGFTAELLTTQQQEYEKISLALASLPEEVSNAFLMHRRDELGYEQIAANLNISTKEVEINIAIALKHLRTEMGKVKH